MLTAVVLRFLRSKLVLTAIFFTSLTYFLLSVYHDGLGLTSISGDNDSPEIGSGRRPLSHTFKWQEPEENNSTDVRLAFCKNSVQGKVLIADDKGYVCNRHNLMTNGCCKPESEGTKRYSCETCHENGCCAIYEHCISCCLQPDKKEVLKDVLGKAAGSLNLLLTSVSNHFELCLTKCRTSSQSVQHENSYRNPRAKHCYGEAPPPLETESAREVR